MRSSTEDKWTMRSSTENATLMLAPHAVLPSGEAVSAKNTLQSFAVPTAEVQQSSPTNDQAPVAAFPAVATAPPPVLPSGEVINAVNTMREFSPVVAVAPRNNINNDNEPLSQDEGTHQEQLRGSTTEADGDRTNLSVAIEAEALTDTDCDRNSTSPQKKTHSVDGDFNRS